MRSRRALLAVPPEIAAGIRASSWRGKSGVLTQQSGSSDCQIKREQTWRDCHTFVAPKELGAEHDTAA